MSKYVPVSTANVICASDELNALPEESVVRNIMFGVVFERQTENDGSLMWASIYGEPRSGISLPVLLLWHPDWEQPSDDDATTHQPALGKGIS